MARKGDKDPSGKGTGKEGDRERGDRGGKGDRGGGGAAAAPPSRRLSKGELNAIHTYMKKARAQGKIYCWQFNRKMGCTVDHKDGKVHECIVCGGEDHGAIPEHGEPQ